MKILGILLTLTLLLSAKSTEMYSLETTKANILAVSNMIETTESNLTETNKMIKATETTENKILRATKLIESGKTHFDEAKQIIKTAENKRQMAIKNKRVATQTIDKSTIIIKKTKTEIENIILGSDVTAIAEAKVAIEKANNKITQASETITTAKAKIMEADEIIKTTEAEIIQASEIITTAEAEIIQASEIITTAKTEIIQASEIITTTKPSFWNSTFDIGLQLLPQYDANGTNQGLKDNRLFANINIDARWLSDSSIKGKNTSDIFNFGVDIKLQGVITQDSNKTNFKSSSFNDVSDTLELSMYAQYIPEWGRFGTTRELYSELGLISHVGFRSLREKSSSADSVNIYIDAGIKYSYFNANPYNDKGIATMIPDYYIGAYIRNYSENIGVGHRRYIIDMKYKIIPQSNFFIGTEANLGEKGKEFYLTLTYRRSLDKLLVFFNQN